MNMKNLQEIENLYKYYTDSSARFVKSSTLLDNDDKDKTLGTETLNLSKDEYIKYLKDVLGPLNKYVYAVTVNKIERDEANSLAFVNYSTKEYSLVTNEKNENLESFITSNCNMDLDIDANDVIILGTNCSEKIVKRNS